MKKKSDDNKENNNLAIGLCLGLSFGLLFDNLALGLCLGVAFGCMPDFKGKGKK